MERAIEVVEVQAGHAAVVKARVAKRDIPGAIMPLVDRVWQVIRSGAVPSHGHNVWIYHHKGAEEVDVEVGVQVPGPFAERDGVVCTQTPSGRVAHAVHYGEYAELPSVHRAVHGFCREQGLTITGDNWEVYGDWEEDPTKRRCDVYYSLG
jgi:effector-binding domain-containing protein